jgi:hypothetical protein
LTGNLIPKWVNRLARMGRNSWKACFLSHLFCYLRVSAKFDCTTWYLQSRKLDILDSANNLFAAAFAGLNVKLWLPEVVHWNRFFFHYCQREVDKQSLVVSE